MRQCSANCKVLSECSGSMMEMFTQQKDEAVDFVQSLYVNIVSFFGNLSILTSFTFILLGAL